VKIAQAILRHNDNLLASRCSKETFRALKRVFPKAKYHEAARTVTVVRKRCRNAAARIAVLCAGTTDIPVAEEAVVTADVMAIAVRRYYDVGIAGLHRLLALMKNYSKPVVGSSSPEWKGALPSVVGGLVD